MCGVGPPTEVGEYNAHDEVFEDERGLVEEGDGYGGVGGGECVVWLRELGDVEAGEVGGLTDVEVALMECERLFG